MDFRLIYQLTIEKLSDRSTYLLVLLVGSLINVYGQLLVPWFRGSSNPFVTFADELAVRPTLTLLSVFLAFAFPFCVSTYSAVAARYKIRRIVSIADFPERKPDPVFRARRDGQLVEVGANTKKLFEKHQVDRAQKILGEEVWAQIVANERVDLSTRVYFAAEDVEYLVACAPTANDQFNIYLTELPKRSAAADS